MNHYTFALPSENQNAFCLLYICANAVCTVIQSLKDILSINFFCKDIHESLKYVDELSEVKKNDEIQKEHASLSLLVDPSVVQKPMRTINIDIVRSHSWIQRGDMGT